MTERELDLNEANKNSYLNIPNIIATIATTVLALTALITVYLTITTWKIEQEVARPYFVLRDSPRVTAGDELSLEFKFSNVGIHPAVNFSSETIIVDERLTEKPIHHDESAIVNEIPKDAASSLIMNIPCQELYSEQTNINTHFVVVDLRYTDPILNKSYTQTIYMKWHGIKKGKIQPTVHVRVEERDKILNYFSRQGIDLSACSQ